MKKTKAYEWYKLLAPLLEQKQKRPYPQPEVLLKLFSICNLKICLWRIVSFFYLFLMLSGGTTVFCRLTAPWKHFQEIKNCFCLFSHTKAHTGQEQSSDFTLICLVLALQYKTPLPFHQFLSFDWLCIFPASFMAGTEMGPSVLAFNVTDHRREVAPIFFFLFDLQVLIHHGCA